MRGLTISQSTTVGNERRYSSSAPRFTTSTSKKARGSPRSSPGRGRSSTKERGSSSTPIGWTAARFASRAFRGNTPPRASGAPSPRGVRTNQGAIAALYEPRAGTLGESLRRTKHTSRPLSDFRGAFEAQGVRDLVAIVGHDALGSGVVLAAPRTREIALRHAERRRYDRLAAELGALTRLRARRRATEGARLSESEARVARRILDGASDKDIAGELGCGLSAVSTFARRLRRKLGCRPGEESLLLSARRSTESLLVRLELFERLSPAECDVLSALLVGARYEEVARWRGTSERTIAAQAAAVFRKAGVSGRRELAAKLLR